MAQPQTIIDKLYRDSMQILLVAMLIAQIEHLAKLGDSQAIVKLLGEDMAEIS